MILHLERRTHQAGVTIGRCRFFFLQRGISILFRGILLRP